MRVAGLGAGAGAGAGAGWGWDAGVGCLGVVFAPVLAGWFFGGTGRPVMSASERFIRATLGAPSPSALCGVTEKEYNAVGSRPISSAVVPVASMVIGARASLLFIP